MEATNCVLIVPGVSVWSSGVLQLVKKYAVGATPDAVIKMGYGYDCEIPKV
jgi:hypothetical protein